MHYIVYFAGPFVLGIVGAAKLAQPFRIFVIGLIAFFLAWVPIQAITGIATQAFGVADGTLVYALIVATCAGVFEESARYVAFGRCASFQQNRNWRASTMYAVGHHGMETIIVGLTLALIYAVVTFKPDAISSPTLLKQCQEVVALGGGTKFYQAGERLAVGLLIHVCFSAVVMLALVRQQRRWLMVAIAWHFLHDLVSLTVHHYSDGWVASKAWIGIIVIGYSYLVVRLYRALEATAASEVPARGASGPPPMILPGRPA